MDTVLSPGASGIETKSQLYARDLLQTFTAYITKIKTLSLDCFDTLLWRKTATPIDVFYALQHRLTFQALDLSAALRVQAEATSQAAF
jgi:hypothetical protein